MAFLLGDEAAFGALVSGEGMKVDKLYLEPNTLLNFKSSTIAVSACFKASSYVFLSLSSGSLAGM